MLIPVELYRLIIIKNFKQFFIYRTNLFNGAVSAFLILAAQYALWTTLFNTGNAGDATLQEIMTYFVVNGFMLGVFAISFSSIIGSDIGSGDIAQKFVRPIPYHMQLLASAHSDALINVVTSRLPVLLIAMVWFGLLAPVSGIAFALFVVTAALGGVIFALVDLIISYTAFWLVSGWYLSWFRRALFTLFGGMMLPLWLYPAWLQTICAFLPFQYAVFQPIAIYLGRVSYDQAAFSLGAQLFWIIALLVIERLIWRKVQHKIIVQGG